MIHEITHSEQIMLAKMNQIVPIFKRSIPDMSDDNPVTEFDVGKHFDGCKERKLCNGLPNLSTNRPYVTILFYQSINTNSRAAITLSLHDAWYEEGNSTSIINTAKEAQKYWMPGKYPYEGYWDSLEAFMELGEIYTRLWWNPGLSVERHVNSHVSAETIFGYMFEDEPVTTHTYLSGPGSYVTPYNIGNIMQADWLHATSYDRKKTVLNGTYNIFLKNAAPTLSLEPIVTPKVSATQDQIVSTAKQALQADLNEWLKETQVQWVGTNDVANS